MRALMMAIFLMACIAEGGGNGDYCREIRDCSGELICLSNACHPRPERGRDGGTSAVPDTGVDAGVDVATDVSPDSPDDAPTDGALDSPDDAPTDGG